VTRAPDVDPTLRPPAGGCVRASAVLLFGLLSADLLIQPLGINTSGHNEAGVPNTSTPGIIGTGAMPSGLPGDNPTAPGFPAIVGNNSMKKPPMTPTGPKAAALM